jgi:hypothetical protein
MKTTESIKTTVKNLVSNQSRLTDIMFELEEAVSEVGLDRLDELEKQEIVASGATEEEADVIMMILAELPATRCETAAHLEAKLKEAA